MTATSYRHPFREGERPNMVLDAEILREFPRARCSIRRGTQRPQGLNSVLRLLRYRSKPP